MLYSGPKRGQLFGIRWLLFGTLALGVLSLQAGRGTLAYFTDSADSLNNTFSTGTVDLQLASDATCAAPTVPYADDLAAPFLNVATQAPGNVVTVPLCVRNNGTLPVDWQLTSVVTDTTSTNALLKAEVDMKVWSVSTATEACTAGYSSDGTSLDVSATQTNFGALLYSTAALSTNPSIPFGTTGASIAATTNQRLCFSAVLPSTVTDSDPLAVTTLQGKSIDADFTINARNQAV